MTLWFVLYGPAADHQFDLMTPYVSGLLCLNDSMMIFMHYPSIEQRKSNMKAQITGIRSVVPLVHRQHGGLPFRQLVQWKKLIMHPHRKAS